MLVKKLKHSNWSMLAIPTEYKQKIDKFCEDNGYTMRSVVETMVELFLDTYPTINQEITYDREIASDSLDKHKTKLRKYPTLADKRKTKTQKTK